MHDRGTLLRPWTSTSAWTTTRPRRPSAGSGSGASVCHRRRSSALCAVSKPWSAANRETLGGISLHSTSAAPFAPVSALAPPRLRWWPGPENPEARLVCRRWQPTFSSSTVIFCSSPRSSGCIAHTSSSPCSTRTLMRSRHLPSIWPPVARARSFGPLPQPSGGVGDASRPARRSGISRRRRLADLDGPDEELSDQMATTAPQPTITVTVARAIRPSSPTTV